MIIQYRQPHALSTQGELSFFSNGSAITLSLDFPYCPSTEGCRVVVGNQRRHSFEVENGVVMANIKHAHQTKMVSESLVSMG